MRRVFVDSSAWHAFVSEDDPGHGRVREAMEPWEGRLVTSNLVFAEAVTLLRGRCGHRAALKAGDWIRNRSNVEMVRTLPEDEDEAWKLFVRHSDKHYSFVDCASFAIMRRLGIDVALSLDKDFAQAGFEIEPGG